MEIFDARTLPGLVDDDFRRPCHAGFGRRALASEFAQDIEPAAQEAVAVVEEFSAAIKAVRIAEASALLDPNVLVLESGGSERSRDRIPGRTRAS